MNMNPASGVTLKTARLSCPKVLSISESPSAEPTRYTMPSSQSVFQVYLRTPWLVQLLQRTRLKDVEARGTEWLLCVQDLLSLPKATWCCATGWPGTGFCLTTGFRCLGPQLAFEQEASRQSNSKSLLPSFLPSLLTVLQAAAVRQAYVDLLHPSKMAVVDRLLHTLRAAVCK